jgi:plastocyanin
VALLSGCNNSPSTPAQKVVATPVDPTTAGTIEIKVGYDGPASQPKEISMRSAPQCAAAHASPVFDQSLVVRDGRLLNAVVWIKQGLEGWGFASAPDPVTIDQKGCVYEPRVAAVMVNQPVQFRNSDPEAHNVHGRPQASRSWNFMMSRPGGTRDVIFGQPEVAVPIGCDIHPWMAGYIAVISNPYFGVTPATGVVTLSNVPPGDYVIGVWHEKLGTKESKVTLPPSGQVSVDVIFAGGR